MMYTNRQGRLVSLAYLAGVVCLALAVTLGLTGGVSQAAGLAQIAPTLGAAASFSVLAETNITNVPTSTIGGDVGLSPATGAGIGLTAAEVGGTIYAVDGFGPAGSVVDPALLTQAINDMTGAFTALDQPCTTTYAGVQDLTIVSPLGPGVYCANAFLLTGNLTLSGTGVWIFKSAATLTTSAGSSVTGGDPCNVWWRLVSAADIFPNSSIIGNIFAGTSINLQTGASLNGRALAQAAVTLDSNSIFGPVCAPAPAPTASSLPSYVSVEYPCAVDGFAAVIVGLSEGVIVYGLGDVITSDQATADGKVVRNLPPGHYEWTATPPAGHYMVTAASGVVDVVVCGSSSGTPAPTQAPPLIPVSGVDLAEGRALATRQLMRVSLGFLGMGLVLLGFALRLRRKQGE